MSKFADGLHGAAREMFLEAANRGAVVTHELKTAVQALGWAGPETGPCYPGAWGVNIACFLRAQEAYFKVPRGYRGALVAVHDGPCWPVPSEREAHPAPVLRQSTATPTARLAEWNNWADRYGFRMAGLSLAALDDPDFWVTVAKYGL